MCSLLVYGVLECGCKNDQYHRRKCPLRRYMGNDSGFRNEPISIKIGRYKLKADQFLTNRWPWPQLQGFDSFHLNVFPPLKKDKVSGRCFVDVSLSQNGVSQVSQITSIISLELGTPFVESKRLCLFHEALPITCRPNKKFDSFTLRIVRLEIHKSRGLTGTIQAPGQAELVIPCSNEDHSEARMARQARCKEQTKNTTTVFKYCCCTFFLLVIALIVLPVIATEILNRQSEHDGS